MKGKSVKDIAKYLSVIQRSVSLIKGILDEENVQLLQDEIDQIAGNNYQPKSSIQPEFVPEEIDTVYENPEEQKARQERKKHINSLMKIDCWPPAMPPNMKVSMTTEDQIDRANSVLDMTLSGPTDGLNFLDFGCGEGWIAQESLNRGFNTVTGYDIVEDRNWENIKEVDFTTKYSDLKTNYYDVIMLYDVLDHCKDPIVLMSQIKSLLSIDGVVYIRCHPWTSRHANHLHKDGLDKAYIHLFLKWEELHELIGKDPLFTRKEISPLEAYHWWFHEFDIIKENPIADEPLSEFFLQPDFKNLIIEEQELKPEDVDGFFKNMSIQFVDFCLKKK